MSIANLGGKGKQLVENNAIYSAILVVIVGVAGFGLGKLSEEPQSVETVAIEGAYIAPELTFGGGDAQVLNAETGQYVGSRNGTKYHFPWCSGAQRMKESNKVWFATKEDAEAAGYSPAANCKGL